MPQSSTIFGALLVGFIFYITIKGELIQYIKVIYGPAPTPEQTNAGTGVKPPGGSSGGLSLGGLFGALGGLFSGGGGSPEEPVGTSSSTFTPDAIE